MATMKMARLAVQVNELAMRLHTAMAEREAMERERRELTAAISHDLRTPLASVRAMVEALDDAVVDDPPKSAAITPPFAARSSGWM